MIGADPGFGRRGAASEAESCRCRGAESCKRSELESIYGYLWPGSGADPGGAPGARAPPDPRF